MNDVKQLLNELYSTYVAGNLVKAEEIALQALAINPTSDYAHVILGLLYRRLNKYEDSLKQFDLIQDLAKLTKETMTNYAAIKSLNNKNAEALEMYAEIVKKNPDFAPAWYNYGYCLAVEQKWKDAINMFNKAEELGFVYELLHATRGLSYNNIKNFSDAERDFKIALTMNPNNLKVSYNLAELYRAMGDYEKSVEEFSKIIKKDPKYPNAMGRRLLARGQMKNEKGKIENHKLAQAEADKIVEFGLPFLNVFDQDRNQLQITKIEISKDGKFNLFTSPINPKK